jgi:hypothetical protein
MGLAGSALRRERRVTTASRTTWLAIQGEGFNPLLHQVLIVFNQGFTPRQFTSEDEVLAAASGGNPEITLVPTDEVYRCSTVRSK